MADPDSLRLDLDTCNWLIGVALDRRNRSAFTKHTKRRLQLLRQLREAACSTSTGSSSPPVSPPPLAPT